MDRARSIHPGYQPSDADLAAFGELSRRLDGLPLAIELAAAWLRVLSPGPCVQRMGYQRLDFLREGARDLPVRQRTLRDTIAWSHSLLSADARLLFARLAVFVGSADLGAIEQVANPRRPARHAGCHRRAGGPEPCAGRGRGGRAAVRDARDDPRVRCRAAGGERHGGRLPHRAPGSLPGAGRTRQCGARHGRAGRVARTARSREGQFPGGAAPCPAAPRRGQRATDGPSARRVTGTSAAATAKDVAGWNRSLD